MKSQLHLLGRGLDAIVQRTVEHDITPELRMRRYVIATILHPDRMHSLRVQIGVGFKDAWARGLTPQLSKWGRAMSAIRRSCDSW